jgi:hypothetical protein
LGLIAALPVGIIGEIRRIAVPVPSDRCEQDSGFQSFDPVYGPDAIDADGAIELHATYARTAQR